ncbi:MAG: hypothetical protein EOM52_08620 [Clostridia bacterium]|nr:hypothetical protein [Clostridia bacterium]
MNLKTIVKVMNFHALLRVDRARREADQYMRLEREVARMLDIIQNNRNFILDKWILAPKDGAPRLRIYFGSDLGFCGAVNASVNSMLDAEPGNNTLIVIGRKIREREGVRLHLNRDDFESRYGEIEVCLAEGIRRRLYSGIDICYNHYYNTTRIEPVCKTIFPIVLERDDLETYTEDFAVEGMDINALMENLLVTYLNYEVKIAAVNAFAAENILRRSATNDSLKKIDEMEVETRWEERKTLNEKAARKVIDSYIKSEHKKR